MEDSWTAASHVRIWPLLGSSTLGGQHIERGGHGSMNTTHRYVEANLEMKGEGARQARGTVRQAQALPCQPRLDEVPADPLTMQSAPRSSALVNQVDGHAGRGATKHS